MSSTNSTTKSLNSGHVFVAGVAMVVASSTMVSEFSGYFTFGGAFVISLAIGFVINMLLAHSAADLSATYPRAGALYEYVRAIFKGQSGRTLATFVGLTFYGMTIFAMSGETASGAFGLRALIGVDASVEWFIVTVSLLAVIPNLFGIKTAAWVSVGLLVIMMGLRWAFGLAGFFGLNQIGQWSAANLQTGHDVGWLVENGILTAGIALAVWSFVGIEFACSLAEDVKSPKKAMPKGMIWGLIVILATSIIMGLGVSGLMPLANWNELASGALAAGGDAPQLAVGHAMFGAWGFKLMALSSVAATLGSLTVAYAAMPRLLERMAADGSLGNSASGLAKTHPTHKTPIRATFLTLVAFLGPALWSSAVVDWVYSAAYVWLLLYIGYHLLVIARHSKSKPTAPHRPGRTTLIIAFTGIPLTAMAIYLSFSGSHTLYGTRAMIVLAVAALITGLAKLPQLSWNGQFQKAKPQPCPITHD